MKERLLTAAIVFIVTICALMPSALTLPPHVDEVQYSYISAYYGGRLIHLDTSPGTSEYLDPGWSSFTWWACTQPMGPRYIYAIALGLTNAPTPVIPFNPDNPRQDEPLARLSDYTLLVMRFTAVLLSALGLAFIAYRLRWPALIASILFLLIPHVRDDLARGWAEGPLLFSFGLAALTYGSRWLFPIICGLAVAMKLNALPLWILAWINGFGRSRFKHFFGLAAAWATWIALMPTAWNVGPIYVFVMVYTRFLEFTNQSATADPAQWGGIDGHYLPTRYLWPLELLALLAIAYFGYRFINNRIINKTSAPLELAADHGE